jgi:uncharacterized protein (TIGR02270 family)
MQHQEAFERCVCISDTAPIAEGLVSALGWVPRDRLAGIGRQLLNATSPGRRVLGLSACRLHGVNPGQSVIAAGLSDASPAIRSVAVRVAADDGQLDFVPAVSALFGDSDSNCRIWALWSAVLLGNRGSALQALIHAGVSPGPLRERAFRLSLQATSVDDAHGVLQSLARDPSDLRWLIRGSGIVGDPTYVPWLITHMATDATARIAGEAFSLITGADLVWLDLERKPPENVEPGPNDDPDDPNVEMDPDDGLPWPDPEPIKDWWDKNSARFQPGTRYFMGAPVTRDHCIDVLKNGYQRQRILAAHYLCLLEPGTPLFNTSAPAWRQQRLLAGMK